MAIMMRYSRVTDEMLIVGMRINGQEMIHVQLQLKPLFNVKVTMTKLAGYTR
jgi:hypothetical protein